jgi:pimeloyl-ACP methyl ester carboxylesterase
MMVHGGSNAMTGKRFTAVKCGLQAARLLLRNMSQVPSGVSNPRFNESTQKTNAGTRYDLYTPEGHIIRTVIIISGLTILGEKDPRVINFARALTEFGIRVAAIALPGLKSYRFEEGDIGAIIDLATILNDKYGQKIGIVAFSIGGTLALTAVIDPSLSAIVDPLILFSPGYSLSEIWDRLKAKLEGTPTNDEDWDNYYWLRLIMAFRTMDSSDFNRFEREELIRMLRIWCFEPTLDEKKEFYERTLKGREAENIENQESETEQLNKISPAGKLHDIDAGVFILHDQYDGLIPPEDSERLFGELSERGQGNIQKICVTPLLSHVTARTTWRVHDLFRIFSIVGEIFREE